MGKAGARENHFLIDIQPLQPSATALTKTPVSHGRLKTKVRSHLSREMESSFTRAFRLQNQKVSWGEVSVSEVLLLTYTGEEVIRRADW